MKPKLVASTITASHFRAQWRTNLVVVVEYELGTERGQSFLQNISENGLFIETTELPLNERISFTFRFPYSHQTFTVEGMTRWRSSGDGETEAGTGVEFIELSKAQQQALKTELSNLTLAVS